MVVELRNLGYKGRLTLIGQEPVSPYQCAPLSKAYLLGDMELESLFHRPDQYCDDQNITLMLGHAVSRVDRAAQSVTVGDEILEYDQLALTTGAVPRRLPVAIGGRLEGVHVVCGLADIDTLSPESSVGRKLLIIGGVKIAAVVLSRI